MSSSPSGITSATTYQAIVIALVAAGIISIGVMSVCYRRRRRDEWERTVRAGLERARYRHGYGGAGGVEGDGLGEKPVLWDVGMDGHGEDWAPIRLGIDDPNHRLGLTNSSLPPTHPDNPNCNKTTMAEITILIAMPKPPFSNPSPSSTSTVVDSNLESEMFTLGDLPHYQHIPHPEEIEGEAEIPYIELGTTVVSLNSMTEEEEGEVEAMRLGSMGVRAGIASDWAGSGGRSR